MQRQRDRANPAHQRAGDCRAGGGADAVQEEHAGVARQDLVLVQVVDQVGDHDRVHRERHAAVDEQTGQRQVGQVAEGGDNAPRQRGAERGDRERNAAIAGVRE